MSTLKFELKVEEANAILNALNMPSQTPATTAVYLINLLQSQAQPQIEKMKEKDEPKTAS